MLLSALREYAEANKELPDFHSRQEVHYVIHLDAAGKLVSFRPLSDPERPSRGETLTIPYKKRANAIVPLPLDRGDYVLGVVPEKKTETERERAKVRTTLAHQAYVALIEEAAAETGSPDFRVLHRFASTVDPENLSLPEGFDPTRFVAVYVDGALPTKHPVARDWWIKRQKVEGEPSAVCGVCGTPCSPLSTCRSLYAASRG